MATTTPRLNLTKPDGTDLVDIAVINANYDILDNQLVTTPSTNYVINGGFDIWQRGTSFATPSAGTYTADRWMVETSGITGITVSRQAFTAGTAPEPGYEGNYFLRYAAGTANSVHGINHKIEDVRTGAGQTITLSFWAKAAASTTLLVNINQYFGIGGSTDVYVERTFALTTTWQRYSYTVTLGSMAGKTIGANSFVNIRLLNTTNTTFTMDFWGVQFELGSTATSFRRNAPSIQGELAACQRYYWNTLSANSNFSGVATVWDGVSNLYASFSNPVVMRTTPAISITNYTDIEVFIDGTGKHPTSYSNWVTSNITTSILLVVSASTIGRSAMVRFSGTAYLQVNAEL